MSIQIELHDDMTRTFSDAGYYIKEEGKHDEWQEAWDPVDAPRVYIETDRPIETPEITLEQIEEAAALLKAARLMLGGDEE